jgi:ribosomal protein L12E/L44/L45/RPP1/RPP2
MGLSKKQMQDIIDNFGEYEEDAPAPSNFKSPKEAAEDSIERTNQVRKDEEERRKKMKGK